MKRRRNRERQQKPKNNFHRTGLEQQEETTQMLTLKLKLAYIKRGREMNHNVTNEEEE